MRFNEILVKKIDLRERVKLQTNHHSLKLIHPSFPLQKKLRHPSFQIPRSSSLHKATPSNLYTGPYDKSPHPRQQKQAQSSPQSPNRYSRQEDKTYNNNYKLFPKRSFLRSPYVVYNSDIVIDVFSKKIEFQERRNDFLASSLSLQLQRSSQRLRTHQKANCMQQRAWERPAKSRKSCRSQSAREVRAQQRPKLERFTPWQVELPEYHQQIPQRA